MDVPRRSAAAADVARRIRALRLAFEVRKGKAKGSEGNGGCGRRASPRDGDRFEAASLEGRRPRRVAPLCSTSQSMLLKLLPCNCSSAGPQHSRYSPSLVPSPCPSDIFFPLPQPYLPGRRRVKRGARVKRSGSSSWKGDFQVGGGLFGVKGRLPSSPPSLSACSLSGNNDGANNVRASNADLGDDRRVFFAPSPCPRRRRSHLLEDAMTCLQRSGSRSSLPVSMGIALFLCCPSRPTVTGEVPRATREEKKKKKELRRGEGRDCRRDD